MKVSLIAAVAEGGVIGLDNAMPWHLPADLKYFKQTTLGKPVVMGRKTFESIGSKPLPGRRNVVVTRDRQFTAVGCDVAHDPQSALELLQDAEEVMVMGGATFYAQMLGRADRLYLTEVHAQFEGDTRFPEYDKSEWREMSRTDHAPDESNPYRYSFVVYERLRVPRPE